MTFEQRLSSDELTVGVIGLGYVGLPLMRSFALAGVNVIGFDVDPAKIDMLHRGENYLKHLGETFVTDMLDTGRFDATSDFARLAEPDAILICVPTPLGHHQEPDLTYVEQTAEAIGKTIRAGQLVVLESTTYPCTTRDVILPRLTAGGLVCGQDFYLAYSPEREDPGRQDHTTQTIPKLVGGIDAVSGELAATLYRKAIKQVILVDNAEIAEAAKLLENIYRAVNIAMVNELKVLLTAMDIDVWKVIEAAATKPFGFQAFYPGPGLGGHCIPIDPFYLTWKAREVGLPTKFIELAGQVNTAMPEYVIQRITLALNEQCLSVKNAKILVLGLAYKPNVDDVRESPSFELVERLQELGANVDYNDPHVPATRRMRRHDLQMTSVDLSADTLAGYDCVVVATHHKAYDWQMVADHAKLVVDTRGVMRGIANPKARIVGA